MANFKSLASKLFNTGSQRFDSAGNLVDYTGPVYNTDVMTPDQWQAFGAAGGTVGDTGTLNLNGTTTGQLGLANSGFLDSIGGLKGLGTIAGIGGGLANALLGYKQLGLQEDAFDFNKAMKEKEYRMAKDAYDKNVARAKSIGEQMRSGAATVS